MAVITFVLALECDSLAIVIVDRFDELLIILFGELQRNLLKAVYKQIAGKSHQPIAQ